MRRDEIFVTRGDYVCIIIMMHTIKCMLESRKGEDLGHFLNRKHWKHKVAGTKSELEQRRVFYVIQPNFEDPDIYKVGIASSDQGKKRLTDYSLSYGVKSDKNPYKGAKIFLVLYNEYHPGTQLSRTPIAQLERKVKDLLTQQGRKDRGNEWFNVPIATLLATIRGFLKTDLNCPSSESEGDDDEPINARIVLKKIVRVYNDS